jgi:hypothetical protein
LLTNYGNLDFVVKFIKAKSLISDKVYRYKKKVSQKDYNLQFQNIEDVLNYFAGSAVV